MFTLHIRVQLPDGTFKHCPVVKDTDNGPKVVEMDNKRDAQDWGNYILPQKVLLVEKK